MSGKHGTRGSNYFKAVPQERVCQCDRAVVMEDGRCVKCGHQASDRGMDSLTLKLAGIASGFKY